MPPPGPPIIAMTRHGLARFAVGDFHQAEQAFRAVAEVAPNQALSWNNLAMALMSLGRPDDAAPVLQQSLSIDPGQLPIWISLASALLQLGRADEADIACGGALSLDQDNAQAWQVRAMARAAAEDFAGAAEAFARTIAIEGESAVLCATYGATLMKCGRFSEAAASLATAIALDPTSEAILDMRRFGDFVVAAIQGDMAAARAAYPDALASSPVQANEVFRTAFLCLDAAGDRKAAILVAEEWAASQPDNIQAAHLRDAALARAVERQPAELVERHFDEIAEDFDDRLVRRLGYQGPQRLQALIAQRLVGEGALEVLDLGCGTGLCAEILRPYARRLVGVDLSTRMLEKAAERGLYDGLEAVDLFVALDQGPAQWDLIVAADTFPYLGALERVFDGAAAALKPHGWLAFSTEGADIDSFLLKPNGRYAHGLRYIQSLAAGRFEIVEQLTAPLRREAGRTVDGGYYLLRLL